VAIIRFGTDGVIGMTDTTEHVDKTNANRRQHKMENDHYGPGTPCSQCGEEIDAGRPEWAEYCYNHKENTEAVPRDELEALADKWGLKADELIHENNDNEYRSGRGGQLAKCSNELRELLQQYTDE